MMQSKSK